MPWSSGEKRDAPSLSIRLNFSANCFRSSLKQFVVWMEENAITRGTSNRAIRAIRAEVGTDISA
eukprot:1190498-Prorocentrum_minimum.AAC.1